jgi:hypothetical protein
MERANTMDVRPAKLGKRPHRGVDAPLRLKTNPWSIKKAVTPLGLNAFLYGGR